MRLTFNIPGIPKAKQSTRFLKTGFAYQKADVVNYTNYIKLFVQSKLEPGYKILDTPIRIDYSFGFPIRKSESKKQVQIIQEAEFNCKHIKKQTKPDLDNLIKMVQDALNQVVIKDDSIVTTLSATKYYCSNPHTLIIISDEN